MGNGFVFFESNKKCDNSTTVLDTVKFASVVLENRREATTCVC